MSRARVRAYRRGLFAETVAALLFRLKGYRVVARRYKTPLGEIDLMALKGQTSCVHRGEGTPESGKCGADPADVAAAQEEAGNDGDKPRKTLMISCVALCCISAICKKV